VKPGTVQVALPPKLIPLFSGPADVRAAKGGRGSGKTRSFAKMTAVMALIHAQAGTEGVILCGRQFMNSLADSSLEEVKAAISSEPWLAAAFDVGEKYIRTRDGRVSYVFSGLDRNIDSVKSKSRILLCWVDEAEPVSDEAWSVLIPTLREEGEGWSAELWVTWNPKRKKAAAESRFANSTDPRIRCVTLNWRDNPKFPDVLERQRQRDMAERPETYGHVWEGEFATVVEGAYFSAALLKARQEGRIGKVAADPLMRLRAFLDIGGTGAKADAFAMWIAQFVAREIRVLNYYETQGQPLAAHVAWMHKNGYMPETLSIWLPHDGETHDRVHDVSYASALRAAEYTVEVVPNQGAGAAMLRVEEARLLFPQIWINEATCGPGLDALGWYHEKRDPVRDIGLGPEHDWASHAADAFGMMCVVYEPPGPKVWGERKRLVPRNGLARGRGSMTA
jgi:phage terminase large subunit